MTRTARRGKADKVDHLPSSSWEEMVQDLPKPKKRKQCTSTDDQDLLLKKHKKKKGTPPGGDGVLSAPEPKVKKATKRKDVKQDDASEGISVRSHKKRTVVPHHRKAGGAPGPYKVPQKGKRWRQVDAVFQRGGRTNRKGPALGRRQRTEEQWQQRRSNMVCFCCRKPGHSMSECPSAGGTKCFKCGAEDHTTKECHTRDEGFPFATCFICNEVGHIARMCPDNPKGIYPQGGGCRFCGSVEHKRANCPERGKKRLEHSQEGLPTITVDSIDAEYQSKTHTRSKKAGQTKKIVTF